MVRRLAFAHGVDDRERIGHQQTPALEMEAEGAALAGQDVFGARRVLYAMAVMGQPVSVFRIRTAPAVVGKKIRGPFL